MEITGLTTAEVQSKQSLGLSNTTIDSYTPTSFRIIFKNIFSVINVVVTPLIVYLAILALYMEAVSMSLFIIINTLTSIFDELRIKREIEQLKTKFQLKAKVIRDGLEQIIPVSEVVNGDTVKVNEGENIIADGVIIDAKVLQIDESIITGESNYIRKGVDEKVFSGSYVITGECYYKVNAVGKDNFTNKILFESTKYEKKKSPMQKNADRLITSLIVVAILLGVLNYVTTTYGATSHQEKILSVTSIISLIIPQTLIFLFTLTFSISISKLFKKGVLVQKGASIENLTNVNILCMDKTGTITTNNMLLNQVEYFNTSEDIVGRYYNSVQKELFGVNKSQRIIGEHYKKYDIEDNCNLYQIPFDSKNKFSYSESTINKNRYGLLLGSKEKVLPVIDSSIKEDLKSFIEQNEKSGYRVIVGAFIENPPVHKDTQKMELPNLSDIKSAVVFVIEEELNKGISDIINKLQAEGIKLKIISGDSYSSVKTIAYKVGIPVDSIVDLSDPSVNIIEATDKYTIFTRAKPEDKLVIINTLKSRGNVVAMTGDGINDVLSLKSADVSIAMESGAEVTRNISDIVLLGNDYEKLPEVFFEGQNIIFNLKLSSKLFLTKSLFAVLLGLIFSIAFLPIPVLPTSILIFSFLGSSLPSYIIIFTRSNPKRSKSFFKEIFLSSIPAGAVFFIISLAEYLVLKNGGIASIYINTAIVLTILGLSLIYSVILIWEAGRLPSFKVVFLALIVAFLVGTMQTTLPIESDDSLAVKIILISLFVFAGILLALLIKYKINIKRASLKIFLYILSFIWIPIVSVLPFRSYYSVTRIDFNMWILILGMIGLGSIVMFVSNRVFKNT